jgi:hypothetical protein
VAFELRTSHLLGKHSNSWAMSSTLFVLFFKYGLTLFPGLAWRFSYLCLLLARMTSVYHISLTFCLDWPWIMILPIFVSPVSWVKGMNNPN